MSDYDVIRGRWRFRRASAAEVGRRAAGRGAAHACLSKGGPLPRRTAATTSQKRCKTNWRLYKRDDTRQDVLGCRRRC